MEKQKPKSIDEYILQAPEHVQDTLWGLLTIILEAASEQVQETISYGVPAIKLKDKPLIYFGGYKKYVSIYFVPRHSEEFKQELQNYKGGKGTVQFPFDKALPVDLIKRIVQYNQALILGNDSVS